MSITIIFSSCTTIHFGEVLYYFQCEVHLDEESTLALVSTYSAPDLALLEASHHTVVSCMHSGDASLQVIDVKLIHAVVAMVTHQINNDERFFVAASLYLKAHTRWENVSR